jgi:hypothetical protein
VIASNTFPSGFDVTQFADDSDPFDTPSIKIANTAMGLNGDLVRFSTAVPINLTLAVVPASADDKNLAVLFEANRVGKGKSGASDEITLTAIYPDGRTLTLSGGCITDGIPSDSVASAGRMKSKPYSFSFENKVSS